MNEQSNYVQFVWFSVSNYSSVALEQCVAFQGLKELLFHTHQSPGERLCAAAATVESLATTFANIVLRRSYNMRYYHPIFRDPS